MEKKIYAGIGTQFVGVSAITEGQKTFNRSGARER
jgi:hypothetical protein